MICVLDDYDELEKMSTAAKLKKMDDIEADPFVPQRRLRTHPRKQILQPTEMLTPIKTSTRLSPIETAQVTRKPRKTKPKSATKPVEKSHAF